MIFLLDYSINNLIELIILIYKKFKNTQIVLLSST